MYLEGHPQLIIYNQQGQIVYSTHAQKKNKLPDLASGVYVVSCVTDKGIINKRIAILGKL